MALHVIVGAGPVGTATARLLVEAGHQVRVVTRSGNGPDHPAVERVAADAGDRDRLRKLTHGAAALYNCANPPYHRWPQDWPPIAAAMLGAAADTGAVLVITGNLYGYGPVGRPMVETDPLAATSVKGRVRARMWQDALAAHRAGRVRVTEARASDFYGPGTDSMVGAYFMPRLLAGRRAIVLGGLDAAHTWTYAPDVGRALVTLGSDPRAWGRAWHVPSTAPRTVREIAVRVCELAGAPAPRYRVVPRWLLRATGAASPVVREFEEVRYQHDRPFVLDTRAYQETFGERPTPLDDGLRATITWWRGRG